MPAFKTFPKVLFTAIDPAVVGAAGGKDVPLAENKNCTRHQLVVGMVGPAVAGTVTVKGIQTGSKMIPANFDSRLDAIDMSTKAAQAFIFYGFFEGLHFDFSGFAAGKKISAALISQETDLLITGNAP